MTKASDLISWQFTTDTGAFVVRWGKSGPWFYKQLLPGGVVDDDRHPPKEIDEKYYRFAATNFPRPKGIKPG